MTKDKEEQKQLDILWIKEPKTEPNKNMWDSDLYFLFLGHQEGWKKLLTVDYTETSFKPKKINGFDNMTKVIRRVNLGKGIEAKLDKNIGQIAYSLDPQNYNYDFQFLISEASRYIRILNESLIRNIIKHNYGNKKYEIFLEPKHIISNHFEHGWYKRIE